MFDWHVKWIEYGNKRVSQRWIFNNNSLEKYTYNYNTYTPVKQFD